ncbi:MAG: ubiquinol-cytochrome c reductase iron-sulfur subunit [Betaproteobacteria bacterium]|nr:ubiquinol-cytochrome c reductase iron-sulfur subunit [Betaproteobacteria bacterium]
MPVDSGGIAEGSAGAATPVPPGLVARSDDPARRRVLVAATSVLGGIGVAAAGVPFFASLLPSARALAAGAPVEVDIGALEPGMLATVEWQRKPVWVLRRSAAMLRLLGENDARLSDPRSEVAQQPEYCRNPTRSIRPDVFVSVALCTHLGCIPSFRPEVAPADLAADWRGGFYCPCHGSMFDLAGRVFRNVPAPTNLVIPRHAYRDESRLVLGEDNEK